MNFQVEFERFEREYPLKTWQAGNLTFRYRLGGTGTKALVLLVGGLGFSDTLYKHFKAFAEHYTVLTFDYPAETDQNTALADGIAALVKELGLGKVFWVGQSYGGLIAQVIAQRHPEITAGLVLSNTGCLDAAMDPDARQTMLNMMKTLQKTILMTRLVPMCLLRGTFLKRMEKHFVQCTPEERQYLLNLCGYMFAKLTNRHERRMCRLMIDLIHQTDITGRDFAYLDKRVLLLLSQDDHTFDERIKKALIEMMPSPTVRTDLSGGHLALLLRIDAYIGAVRAFIDAVDD